MPEFEVATPDGQRFRVSIPDEAQGAREAAAARTQQAVHPEGGRKEGAISAWIDSQGGKIKDALERMFKHPEEMVGTHDLGPELGALKLVPVGLPNMKFRGGPRYVIAIHDVDTGQRVGVIDATYNEHKKSIDINMIQSEKPREQERPGSLGFAIHPDAHTLGPRDIRSLLPQAKEMFPEAESVRGFRVTGARNATGQLGGTTLPLPGSKMKPQADPRPKIDPEIADWTMRQWEEAPISRQEGEHNMSVLENLLGPGPPSLR